MALCPKCKVNPRVEYPSRKRAQGYCKQCWSDRANEWNKKNRDRVRDLKFRRKFGITLEDYKQMAAAQNGACAICLEVSGDENRIMAVDHDHRTGKVRGLLCGSCNRGIGLLKDSPLVLHSAIQYLNQHRV